MAYFMETQATDANGTVVFTLPAAQMKWVVGLSYFELTYGSDNHHVEEMSVSLDPHLSGTTLKVDVRAILDDDSGHRIDAGASIVQVTCIATDTDDELANAPNIPAVGGGSFPFYWTSSNLPLAAGSMLAGFMASYGNTDHHVLEASATTSYYYQQPSTAIAAVDMIMDDDSGHSATVATVDVGVLGALSPAPHSPNIEKVTTQLAAVSSVVFPSPVTQAVALINAFRVEYSKHDHHVKTISVGCSTPPIIDAAGTQVTLPATTGATMTDGHNTQDNSVSDVSMLIVAI